MKAVVYRGVGQIRMEEVPDPRIEAPTDAIVRITRSAICGTDLHLIRGTVSGMKPGTVLGHEGVGVVEEVGSEVRNLNRGDRVIIPSSICCGYCSYCRAGYQSQCDNANPHGTASGTAYYGGPEKSGPFPGLQAEKARIPFAYANLVKIPVDVSDDQAILISDVFPTGYFGAMLAEVRPGDTVAVFGCGPVGQFAIASAKHLGADRIFAVDAVPSRLVAAKAQGAEVIDFEKEHPVETIRRLTGGIGVDRVIDAVGVDASRPHHGPAAPEGEKKAGQYEQELAFVAPESIPSREGDHWHPGDAPTQALRWEVASVAKAGTLGIVGVYPETLMVFPIGKAMGKNITIKMGNCNHRKYVPLCLELVRSKIVDPSRVITQHQPMGSVIEAYEAFDRRESGWIKVVLTPEPAPLIALESRRRAGGKWVEPRVDAERGPARESMESGIVSPVKDEILAEHARLFPEGEPTVRTKRVSRGKIPVEERRAPGLMRVSGRARKHRRARKKAA